MQLNLFSYIAKMNIAKSWIWKSFLKTLATSLDKLIKKKIKVIIMNMN